MTARISIRTGRSVVAHDTDFAAGLRDGATVLVRAQKTGLLDGHSDDARCLAAPTSVEDDRHARQLIMWLEEEVGSVRALEGQTRSRYVSLRSLSLRAPRPTASDDDLLAMSDDDACMAVRAMRGGTFDQERAQRVFGSRLAAMACALVENSPSLLPWVVETLGTLPKGLMYSAARTQALDQALRLVLGRLEAKGVRLGASDEPHDAVDAHGAGAGRASGGGAPRTDAASDVAADSDDDDAGDEHEALLHADGTHEGIHKRESVAASEKEQVGADMDRVLPARVVVEPGLLAELCAAAMDGIIVVDDAEYDSACQRLVLDLFRRIFAPGRLVPRQLNQLAWVLGGAWPQYTGKVSNEVGLEVIRAMIAVYEDCLETDSITAARNVVGLLLRFFRYSSLTNEHCMAIRKFASEAEGGSRHPDLGSRLRSLQTACMFAGDFTLTMTCVLC